MASSSQQAADQNCGCDRPEGHDASGRPAPFCLACAIGRCQRGFAWPTYVYTSIQSCALRLLNHRSQHSLLLVPDGSTLDSALMWGPARMACVRGRLTYQLSGKVSLDLASSILGGWSIGDRLNTLDPKRRTGQQCRIPPLKRAFRTPTQSRPASTLAADHAQVSPHTLFPGSLVPFLLAAAHKTWHPLATIEHSSESSPPRQLFRPAATAAPTPRTDQAAAHRGGSRRTQGHPRWERDSVSAALSTEYLR
ncbi:hypothetical protein BD289DRAFT_206948 [Coniella lustricola]|uniref:Uncharacterized protein n=1 Tax=Coniella lustricola TaxID=2025994 RepID=A0A2T3AC83_9PEZI|nr:hypothetical protein BD289DRAFT_206948 [Coniella lustricola]